VRYPLASSTWGNEELAAIQRVVCSGRYTMGDEVRRFEDAFAAKCEMAHAVMVNSGSSANLVAVASLFYKQDRPLQRGDEVIVPALSWATTYHPLQQYGLKLRFVDIDLETLNLDVAQLESALTPQTRMVVAVSILGNPAPLDVIRSFCDRHGLYLFEDNCESMGATLNGKPCGTFGHLNTFSTFYSHHISTMEGGIILTDDRELADLCRVIRNHGWDREVRPDKDPFFEAYRFTVPGYNVRPLEFSGAIGLEQLKKLDAMIYQRRKNAHYFWKLFKDDSRFIIQREHGRSSWFAFTLIPHTDAETYRAKLRSAGIEFRMITGGCFLKHEASRYFDYTAGSVVHAEIAHERGFFVGNHPRDLTAELTLLRKVLA